METPAPLQTAAAEDDAVTIRRREYDDGAVIVVDFGAGVEAKLDVVGETAIVVAGERQFEFEIPPDAEEITTSDGILEIRT